MISRSNTDRKPERGRFAPSPTGRMHLGNVFAALMSWLAARSRGGEWLLRIEDLDPQRSRREYARLIEDDLHWLGLDWDAGGVDGDGPDGPYLQSGRSHIYNEYMHRLRNAGLTYPCRCTRADIMSTQAPHQSDGRVIYSGRCRPSSVPPFVVSPVDWQGAGERLYVDSRRVEFVDEICGKQSVRLDEQCGDFLLRRADGAWAYQLAVVVDDALMGVTQVVRGNDLLLSAAQQIYLHGLLGFEPPSFAHIPLICAADGRRLSKRDKSLSMEMLRRNSTPEQIIGYLASIAGLCPEAEPCSASDLVSDFDISRICHDPAITLSTEGML